jgi:hypothetical protein
VSEVRRPGFDAYELLYVRGEPKSNVELLALRRFRAVRLILPSQGNSTTSFRRGRCKRGRSNLVLRD